MHGNKHHMLLRCQPNDFGPKEGAGFQIKAGSGFFPGQLIHFLFPFFLRQIRNVN